MQPFLKLSFSFSFLKKLHLLTTFLIPDKGLNDLYIPLNCLPEPPEQTSEGDTTLVAVILINGALLRSYSSFFGEPTAYSPILLVAKKVIETFKVRAKHNSTSTASNLN